MSLQASQVTPGVPEGAQPGSGLGDRWAHHGLLVPHRWAPLKPRPALAMPALAMPAQAMPALAMPAQGPASYVPCRSQ